MASSCNSVNPDINTLITWPPLLTYGDHRMAEEMEKEKILSHSYTLLAFCLPPLYALVLAGVLGVSGSPPRKEILNLKTNPF